MDSLVQIFQNSFKEKKRKPTTNSVKHFLIYIIYFTLKYIYEMAVSFFSFLRITFHALIIFCAVVCALFLRLYRKKTAKRSKQKIPASLKTQFSQFCNSKTTKYIFFCKAKKLYWGVFWPKASSRIFYLLLSCILPFYFTKMTTNLSLFLFLTVLNISAQRTEVFF